MKKYLLFLLKFVIISAILYLCKDPLIFAYEIVLLFVMSLFTADNMTYYYDSSFRLILLASLLLATPGVNLKRRFLFAFYGLCSLWLLDLISFFIWTTPPPMRMGVQVDKTHLVYSLIWRTLGHWIIPFVCWVLMAKQLIYDRLAVMSKGSKSI